MIRATCGWRASTVGELRPPLGRQPDLVEARHRGDQRRVVHREHGRLLGLLAERPVEPLDPPSVERPAFDAGHDRVEADQPQRPQVDRVGDVLLALAGQPERLAQRPAQIVVAGQDVRLEVERGDQLAHPRVLLRGAVLGQVAGDHQGVGPLGQIEDRLDRAQQALVRFDALPVRTQVGVGDLQEKEGRVAHRSIAASLRAISRCSASSSISSSARSKAARASSVRPLPRQQLAAGRVQVAVGVEPVDPLDQRQPRPPGP